MQLLTTTEDEYTNSVAVKRKRVWAGAGSVKCTKSVGRCGTSKQPLTVAVLS